MEKKSFWNGSNLFNIGLALTFIGLGIQIALGEIGLYFGSICSTAGILITFKGYLMQKNPKRLKKDERSKKIGAFAAAHSWIITVLALVLIFWINKLNLVPLNVDAVIGITYIVMVGSLIGYKYYFDKKGDIE